MSQNTDKLAKNAIKPQQEPKKTIKNVIETPKTFVTRREHFGSRS